MAKAWAYRDYTTIGPGPANDLLARIALRPENQERFLERTRSILNTNYPVLRDWATGHDGVFTHIEPKAGAIAYLRYDLDIDSLDFVERLREEKSVLIVAGEHFQMGKYLRIGFGSNADYLREGLNLISEFVSQLREGR